MRIHLAAACAVLASCLPAAAGSPELDAMIERHAARNGLPVALVHRVVKAESGYNPLASNRGNHGLMQIRAATARGMGYRGGVSGLLDAETNLTYAVAYLAGAYRAAGGHAGRAVAYYRSGYYRRGRAPATVPADPSLQLAATQAALASAPKAPAEGDFLARLFGGGR